MDNLTNDSEETLIIPRRRTSKLSSILSRITIEPIAFYAHIAKSMITIVTQNLTQEKICEQFYHGSKENCSNYMKAFNGTNIADDIQRDASDYSVYNDLITNIPAMIVLMVVAQWSDRHGRKVILMLPLAGRAISSICISIVATYGTSTPQDILLSMIPLGISGGHPMLTTACFSYLSDVTTDEERTFRVALMDGLTKIGDALGAPFGEYIYTHFGYTSVYVVSSVLDVFIFVYATLSIRNIKPEKSNCHSNEIFLETAAPAQTERCCMKFLHNITDNVRVCFKKREGFLRTFILLLLLCDILHQFPISGEGQLMYLYTRKMYNWNVKTFTNYKTFLTATSSVGVFLLMPICAKTFHIRDSILGIVGNLAKLIGSFIKIFSFTSAILWLGSTTGIIAGFANVIDRAMLSKCVPATELGKVFAVESMITSVATIAANMGYTLVYNTTLETFPGSIFIISTAISFPTLLIFCFISYAIRKNPNESSTM